MDTTTTMLVLVVFGTLIIVGLIGAFMSRYQRTKRLQERFGPEYDRTVNELGDKRQAEHDLENRLEHVKKLDIRPLSADEMDRFTAEWQTTQAEFVDAPLAAIRKADQLLSEVMQARGYPVEDFEQGVADISVDFPDLVVDYRGLHLIATRGDKEEVSTEEMRKAMVHARALFENLVKNERNVEELDEKEKT
ncbi:MAG TPA: hypothetical protein VFR47_32200 [Anaerolineales bacterium]|nr:hypothetical protein [Anaerolineales bacterium]